MIRFFVAGNASPGGSKTAFVRGGKAILVDAGKRNAEWKATVARAAAEAYQGPLLSAPLDVTFEFFTVRPRGHFRTGKNSHMLKDSAPTFPARKPDLTKLVRAAEDALTGVLWVDDALIVDQTARKSWGGRPGVRITVKVKAQ